MVSVNAKESCIKAAITLYARSKIWMDYMAWLLSFWWVFSDRGFLRQILKQNGEKSCSLWFIYKLRILYFRSCPLCFFYIPSHSCKWLHLMVCVWNKEKSKPNSICHPTVFSIVRQLLCLCRSMINPAASRQAKEVIKMEVKTVSVLWRQILSGLLQ